MQDAIFLTIVCLIDPIRVGIVLVTIWLWRSPWAILAAIVLSAVTVETLMTAMPLARRWAWGTAIVPGTIASAILAGLIYRLASLWARTAPAAQQINPAQDTVAHSPVSQTLTALRPLTPKKVIFNLFEFAFFVALFLAYLALFRLLFTTAYSVLQMSG